METVGIVNVLKKSQMWLFEGIKGKHILFLLIVLAIMLFFAVSCTAQCPSRCPQNLTAQRRGIDVVLIWDVVNETDTECYEIERSADGKTFERIGRTGVGVRRFIDNFSRIAYYRIIKRYISSIRTEKTEIVSVLPFEQLIEIFDIYGRIVRNADSYESAISNLPPSVYFVKSGGESRLFVKK